MGLQNIDNVTLNHYQDNQLQNSNAADTHVNDIPIEVLQIILNNANNLDRKAEVCTLWQKAVVNIRRENANKKIEDVRNQSISQINKLDLDEETKSKAKTQLYELAKNKPNQASTDIEIDDYYNDTLLNIVSIAPSLRNHNPILPSPFLHVISSGQYLNDNEKEKYYQELAKEISQNNEAPSIKLKKLTIVLNLINDQQFKNVLITGQANQYFKTKEISLPLICKLLDKLFNHNDIHTMNFFGVGTAFIDPSKRQNLNSDLLINYLYFKNEQAKKEFEAKKKAWEESIKAAQEEAEIKKKAAQEEAEAKKKEREKSDKEWDAWEKAFDKEWKARRKAFDKRWNDFDKKWNENTEKTTTQSSVANKKRNVKAVKPKVKKKEKTQKLPTLKKEIQDRKKKH